MDDETPILEEASSESDVEVLEEVTSVPFVTQAAAISHNEDSNLFIPPSKQSVSSETNQNVGSSVSQSTSSAAKCNKDADSSTSQLISTATKTDRDADQSTSSTTETNRKAVPSTTELILSAPEMNQVTTQEGASSLDCQQLASDDPPLPPGPPAYHDIIPLIHDGPNVPPPFTFKSLCFCFFGAYRLYYARKIRNPKYILILLVALLVLPVSAIYMEMITFYQNIPVFDDPKNSLYCAELLHTYIFYMNFVVPTIGILALLLHLPMKPVDNTRRSLQEAERDAFRQHQTVEGAPCQVYTAWIKPRRPRSGGNAENAEGHENRSHRNEEAAEICAPRSRRTEESIIGGAVEGPQRDEVVVSGDIRVRWWDEGDAVSGDTRSHPWDEEGAACGPIGGNLCDEEYSLGGAVGGYQEDEEGAVGGYQEEEGAVGGAMENCRCDEGSAGCGEFGSLRWDERGTLYPPPNDREALSLRFGSFSFRRSEKVVESTALRHNFKYHRMALRSNCRSSRGWGEENEFSRSSRYYEEGDGFRSRRRYEGSKYADRSKMKDSNEGDVALKRKESDQDDVRFGRTESSETEPLWNEDGSESDVFGTSWNKYGARPKRKVSAECPAKTKEGAECRARTKEGTESVAKPNSKERAEDGIRLRRNKSTENKDLPLQDREDEESDASGNQWNVSNEGDARPKNEESDIRPKKTEGAESRVRSRMKGNAEVEMKEVAESGVLPKKEEGTESSATPKMKESTEKSTALKRQERIEFDDRPQEKESVENGARPPIEEEGSKNDTRPPTE